MSSTIIITYELHPPAGVTAPANISTSKKIEIPLTEARLIDNQKSYYAALHNAIEDARNKIGEDLTAWKDAVGKKELDKEAKRSLKEEEEEEEEEEEDEEEA